MKLPGGDATQSVSRSSVGASATSAPDNTGFTVAGERDAVFDRIGEVLAATDGVTIASKAQILGTYDVDYEGSKFLLRVTKVQAGAYVSAVDPRGLPASGDARSEEHTSNPVTNAHLVCRLLLEKNKKTTHTEHHNTHQ